MESAEEDQARLKLELSVSDPLDSSTSPLLLLGRERHACVRENKEQQGNVALWLTGQPKRSGVC